MWLKMCPKCKGDLYLRDEPEGKDIVCLQCGLIRPFRLEDDELLARIGLESPEKRLAA